MSNLEFKKLDRTSLDPNQVLLLSKTLTEQYKEHTTDLCNLEGKFNGLLNKPILGAPGQLGRIDPL